jgi:hypothetical protein
MQKGPRPKPLGAPPLIASLKHEQVEKLLSTLQLNISALWLSSTGKNRRLISLLSIKEQKNS